MQFGVMKSHHLKYQYLFSDQDLSAYVSRFIATLHHEVQDRWHAIKDEDEETVV